MRQVKHYFNLIEIALALAVLAIGMSSALLMFVAGANTSRKSMDESYIADAYSEIFAYLRTEVLKNAPDKDTEESKWDFNDFEFETSFKKYGYTFNESDGKDTFLKKGDGLIYRKFGSAGELVFSALIEVKRDHTSEDISGFGEEYFLDAKSGTQEKLRRLEGAEIITKKIIMPLLVTIGYPADIPWNKQEKKTFRIEIYNEKFGLK